MTRANVAKKEILKAFPDADTFFIAKTVQRPIPGTNTAQLAAHGIFVPANPELEKVTLYSVQASAHGWNFVRRWYYWSARSEDRPISNAKAAAFALKWGSQVRIDGYSGGGPLPADGKSVHLYHVDTVEGLAAFAELLRGPQ